MQPPLPIDYPSESSNGKYRTNQLKTWGTKKARDLRFRRSRASSVAVSTSAPEGTRTPNLLIRMVDHAAGCRRVPILALTCRFVRAGRDHGTGLCRVVSRRLGNVHYPSTTRARPQRGETGHRA